jgi:molecular chaperone GrpE (heat shock protein)
MDFIEQRYNYLEEIIKKIDEIICIHITKYRSQQIEKSTDPIEQIKILNDEAEKRFYCRYTEELNALKLIFETGIDDNRNKFVVNKYREYLINVLDEIFKAIQTLEYIELSPVEFVPEHVKENYLYAKLFDSEFDAWKNAIIKEFNKELINIVEIKSGYSYSYEELYTLIHAGYYDKLKKI